MSKMMKNSEILVRALAYLKANGVNHDGGFVPRYLGVVPPLDAKHQQLPACALGALNIALDTDDWWFEKYVYEVRRYVEDAANTKNLPVWNDTASDAEVLQAFEKAIVLAREAGD